ncbi:MAG TPA: DUF354 domain-containing protein [Thermoleophilia bacterium]|nr:DUF354 domain-containing protein [Thermoleophilia bacterium]
MDITEAADVVFFAPIVRRLESSGHTVTVTARRFASADLVLRRYGVGAVLVGHHRGGGVAARTVGLANRTRQLLHSASDGRFDVAAGSHTSDFVLAGWTLGIPQMTFLEEEGLGNGPSFTMRLADEVAVPDAIGADALSAVRPSPRRFVRYPGFREEYYLHDMSPDPGALRRLAVDERHVVGVVRPARPVGMPSPGPSPGEEVLAGLVRAVAGRRNVTLVLLARDREQRQRFLALGAPGLVAPEGPVDGVGLIAAADFVLGDGGIMTREAAALGTPAYTVAKASLTTVDRLLLRAGRLRIATLEDDLQLRKKDSRTATFEPRDPQIFVDELLALARERPRRARAGGLAGADRAIP